MRRLTLSLTLLLLLLTALSGTALALKVFVKLTPENARLHGFDVSTVPYKSGAIEFTVLRDLSFARVHSPESGLVLRRGSTLHVEGDNGIVVRCAVEAVGLEGKIRYRFSVGREFLGASRFVVTEIDDYADRPEHLLGGGTYFEMQLSRFATADRPTPPTYDPEDPQNLDALVAFARDRGDAIVVVEIVDPQLIIASDGSRSTMVTVGPKSEILRQGREDYGWDIQIGQRAALSPVTEYKRVILLPCAKRNWIPYSAETTRRIGELCNR